MKPKDIRRVERLCGIVVVECAKAEDVRLMEPPVDAGVPAQAQAALNLFRRVRATEGNHQTYFYKGTLIEWFVAEIFAQTQPPVVAPVARVKGK